MLYLNRSKEIVENKKRPGKFGILLGEEGRGRALVYVPFHAHTSEKTLRKGLHKNLSIEVMNGFPVIVEKSEDTVFMLFNTCAGYTRRGNGYLKIREKDRNKVEVVARGNGADGAAGRIGSWDELIVKVLDPDVVFNEHKSGGHCGPTIYVIRDQEVLEADKWDIPLMFIDIGEKVPFTVENTVADGDDTVKLDADEWALL